MSDAGASSSRLDTDVSPRKATLESMPHEILVQIWIHLDDPSVLARTSWNLRRASQACDLRARWLLAEFGPAYALFQAIARPKVFNAELCNLLIAYGANVSLALTQELAKRYFATGNGREELESKDKWGMGITFPAAMAVMAAGVKRYPHWSMDGKYNEMKIFTSWLQNTTTATPRQLRALFIDREFAPLPLRTQYNLPSSNLGVQASQTLMSEKYPPYLYQFAIMAQYLNEQQRQNAHKAKTWKNGAPSKT